MERKTLIFSGLGVLVLGAGIGYGVGLLGRSDGSWERGVGQRDGSGFGRMEDRGYGKSDTSRGGMMERDDRGNGQGEMKGMMGGGRGLGFGGGGNAKDCYADGCLSVDGLEYPVGTLSDAAKQAVLSAIDDEYKARATYDVVLSKYGTKRPFSMIRRSEDQHIAALSSILDKYGVAVPSDPWTGKVTAPESFAAACQTGVDAEIANAALYRDQLLPAVKEYPDIVSVFTNLMSASQERHLPAFDRCN